MTKQEVCQKKWIFMPALSLRDRGLSHPLKDSNRPQKMCNQAHSSCPGICLPAQLKAQTIPVEPARIIPGA